MEQLYYQMNPWWENLTYKTGIKRDLYLKKIDKELRKNKIIILTGLRRIGKTTIIKQTIKELIQNKKIEPIKILYLTLDHIKLTNMTIHDLISKYRELHKLSYTEKIYLFLDEITANPNFEQELKNIHDIENIKIICSSSISTLMNNKKAFLTGRTKTIEIQPLNFLEFLQFKKIKYTPHNIEQNNGYFEDYLKIGGIPEYVLTEDSEYLNELINDIIYKDIISYYKIPNPNHIKELFKLLCFRIGKPTSYNKLSKILKISDDTIKKYISYFENSFLFETVERYSKSYNEKITSPKKFYIADLGLKNLITEFKEKGPNFENLVYQKIKKENPNYYLEKGIEIDFITKDKIIEAKYRTEITEKQKKILEKFKNKKKIIIAQNYKFFTEEEK